MVQIDLVWAQLSPRCLHSESVEGKAACQAANSAVRRKAVWRRGGHFPIRKGCRQQNFPRCAPNHGGHAAASAGRLWRPFFEMSATHLSGSRNTRAAGHFSSSSRRVKITDYVVSRSQYLGITRDTRDHLFTLASRAREILEARSRTGKSRLRCSEVEVKGPRLPRGKGKRAGGPQR